MQLQPRSVYQQGEILEADATRLIILLYRGALEAIGRARDYQAKGEIRLRAHEITRAFEIIAELAAAVDRDKGADLALRLLQLYDYMQQQLNRANAEQNVEPLTEVETLLRGLLEAWEGARAQLGANQPPVPPAYAAERKPLRYSA